MTTISEKFYDIEIANDADSKQWYEERNWCYYRGQLSARYDNNPLNNLGCDQGADFESICQGVKKKVIQPTWDLNNLDNGIDEKEVESCSESNSINDKIAWYKPAIFHNKDYGIYIKKNGLLCLAKRLKENKALNGNNADDLDYITLAFLILFYHETCHFWVEELCSLYRAYIDEHIYENRQQQFGSYILMEEAICNSFALGWLKYVLQFHNGRDHTIEVIKQWMDTQPAGYSDYFDANWLPECTYELLFNLKKLLVNIYGANPDIADHVIKTYVGPWEFALSQNDDLKISAKKIEGVHKELFHEYRYCPLSL